MSRLSKKVLKMCKKRKWDMHWTARGAYLHLESSELIESIRGKHGDPLKEAADVLLVLMSMTESNGLDWDDIIKKTEEITDKMMIKPQYKGESTVEGDIK